MGKGQAETAVTAVCPASLLGHLQGGRHSRVIASALTSEWKRMVPGHVSCERVCAGNHTVCPEPPHLWLGKARQPQKGEPADSVALTHAELMAGTSCE